MDSLDATPSIARSYEYEGVMVYHCQLYVVLWLKWLPEKPLREFRFRCQRCGASLSAIEAGAEWTRQADSPGVPNCRKLPTLYR